MKQYALLLAVLVPYYSIISRTITVKDHLVAQDLKEILDAHSSQLESLIEEVHATKHQKHGVWQFDWLQGYYIKYNVSRVPKRECVARCIKKHGLDLLHTPKKYYYHLKGRPRELHNLNYVVVIKALEHHLFTEPMGFEQIRQFIKLIETSGHCSTFSHNYVRLEDGRISFIDTDGTFNPKNPIRGIIWLLNEDLESYYSEEAGAYILDTIAYYYVRLSEEDKRRYKQQIKEFLEEQHPRVRKQLKEHIRYHKGEVR